MAEPLPPHPLEELLAGYVLGDLSAAEAEQVTLLLADHPDLVKEVNQLREALATIPYGLPPVTAPEHLRAAMLDRAIAPSSQPSIPATKRRSLKTWGSLAAVFLVAMALDNFHLRQKLATSQNQITQQQDLISMLQTPQSRVIALRGMDRLATASGSAVLAPGHTNVILVLQNLPDLPESQYYCLWAISGDRKQAIGWFQPNSQGYVFVKVPLSSIAGLSGLAVTIENLPTPQSPRGPLVMSSNR